VALGVVGLIVAAFAAMKEALSKTTEGQAVLNKVTDAFSKLLAPVMTLISAVAVPVFETLATVIDKVAGAFQFVAEKLGFAKSEIQKFDTAAVEASKNAAKSAQDDLDNMAKVIQMQKDAAAKAEADRKARRAKELQEKADQEAEALREEQERLDGILKEYEKRRKAREKLNFETLNQESIDSRVAAAKKEEDDRLKREKDTEDKIKYLKINTVEEQENIIKGIKKSSLLEQAEAVSAGLKQETEYVELTTEDKIGIISDGLGAVASLVGENTAAGKALAVAQAAIDTYAGANKALATYPPPFGAIAAGTVIVAGLLNVKKILSTQLPKIPGAKSAPSIAGSVATPSVPTIASLQAPQITTTGGSNPTTQLAQTISNANRPIQAYVVSGQVSTQQALDRRVNRAATLSGG
jgi:chemotaxis protein histidine kinase CheA